MSNVVSDRKYTKDHEWAKTEGSSVQVGNTAYAVEQLGDITLVNFDVKVGDTLSSGKTFGTIESVKTLSDLYAPATGKVVALNAELASSPELVNEDCYGKAWMIAIDVANASDISSLMDAATYTKHVEAK